MLMTEVVIALLVGLVCVAAGWALGRWFPGPDAKRLADVQQKLAESQQREEEYRRVISITIIPQVIGVAPSLQHVQLTASEDIEVLWMDYCIDTGARVDRQEMKGRMNGRVVRVPIADEAIIRLQQRKSDGRTGAADIRFKLLVRVLGQEREVDVPARMEVVFEGTRVLRNVIG